MALVVATTQRSFPDEPVVILLVPGEETGGAVEMPWDEVTGVRAGGSAAGAAGQRGSGARAQPRLTPPVTVPDSIPSAGPPAHRVAEGPGVGPAGGERRVEGPPVSEGRPGRRLLGARLGDGRVWVRPGDAIAAAFAGRGRDTLSAAAHAALLDSVISARVTAFMQEMPPDSFAAARPPSWVTEIDGQKWGVDGSWIYLGGLKLPSAILALIPLPQGNFDANKRNAELQRIREDIMQAARRAESLEQFKKYVKETRERKDAEREARKNQRVKPDSIRT
jgi:hypothetical protein